jgi:hypothetical protein
MDYRIWGKVHHLQPGDFFVVATAVPDPPTDRPIVLTLSSSSLLEANQERSRLMIKLGEQVRERGDRVVDVEED